jgi:hypothetical protein
MLEVDIGFADTNYGCKRRMKVTPESVAPIRKEAAKMLSLPDATIPPNIRIISEEEARALRAKASYDPEHNTYTSCETDFEAVVFHECVHNVMAANGLTCNRSCRDMNTQGILVDETMAEFCTSRRYGLSENNKKLDIEELYQAVQQSKTMNLRMLAQMEPCPAVAQAAQKAHNRFMHIEVAHWHKRMEEMYIEHLDRGREAARAAVQQEYYLDIDRSVDLPLLIRSAAAYIAIEKANMLRARGYKASRLAQQIAMCMEQRQDPFDIYFGTIVTSAYGK